MMNMTLAHLAVLLSGAAAISSYAYAIFYGLKKKYSEAYFWALMTIVNILFLILTK